MRAGTDAQGEQHRGDLLGRHPRTEGAVAGRPEGQIVALLGANGAGKSTTLKAISGLLKSEEGEVTDGEILFGGEKINGKDPEEIVRRGFSR